MTWATTSTIIFAHIHHNGLKVKLLEYRLARSILTAKEVLI